MTRPAAGSALREEPEGVDALVGPAALYACALVLNLAVARQGYPRVAPARRCSRTAPRGRFSTDRSWTPRSARRRPMPGPARQRSRRVPGWIDVPGCQAVGARTSGHRRLSPTRPGDTVMPPASRQGPGHHGAGWESSRRRHRSVRGHWRVRRPGKSPSFSYLAPKAPNEILTRINHVKINGASWLLAGYVAWRSSGNRGADDRRVPVRPRAASCLPRDQRILRPERVANA